MQNIWDIILLFYIDKIYEILYFCSTYAKYMRYYTSVLHMQNIWDIILLFYIDKIYEILYFCFT